MKAVNTQLITDAIAALFIVLFTYTGITKLIQHDTFVIALSQAPVIGAYPHLWAWFIPVTELMTSILLFIPGGRFRIAGLIASFLLMFGFTLYILLMMLYVPDLPCSCGGVISGMTWTQHLVFNIIFTSLSTIAIWLWYKNKFFIAINRQSRKPV